MRIFSHAASYLHQTPSPSLPLRVSDKIFEQPLISQPIFLNKMILELYVNLNLRYVDSGKGGYPFVTYILTLFKHDKIC